MIEGDKQTSVQELSISGQFTGAGDVAGTLDYAGGLRNCCKTRVRGTGLRVSKYGPSLCM